MQRGCVIIFPTSSKIARERSAEFVIDKNWAGLLSSCPEGCWALAGAASSIAAAPNDLANAAICVVKWAEILLIAETTFQPVTGSVSHREEVVLNDLRRIQRATDASLPRLDALQRKPCVSPTPLHGVLCPGMVLRTQPPQAVPIGVARLSLTPFHSRYPTTLRCHLLST
jgi:hypothetical protein